MTNKAKILQYLEDQPLFRERKNKDRGIVNMLMRKYRPLEDAIMNGVLTKDTVTAMVQDYASMDRAWRQALERNPGLRGEDYDEKESLEMKKLDELGYNVPHESE